MQNCQKKFLTFIALLGATQSFAQNPCGNGSTIVSATNLEYTPAVLNIAIGETVAWVNYEGVHNVNGQVNTLTNEPFDNPQPFSFSTVTGSPSGVCIGEFTFTEPGVYNYDCSVGSHALAGMVGEIVVGTPGCVDPDAENYDPSADFDDGSCILPTCGVTDHVVNASSFQYDPNVLNVAVGETVGWVNLGGSHDVNAVINSITNEPYNNPETFDFPVVTGNPDGVCIGTFSFSVPGIYDYDCSVGSHAEAGMVGQIVVGVPGCLEPFADNYNPDADFDDGSCEFVGCTDPQACNFDITAIDDDGSCTYPGCRYPNALNYEPNAGCDDLSCIFEEVNDCPSDINNDGIVNTADLLNFLSDFGTDC